MPYRSAVEHVANERFLRHQGLNSDPIGIPKGPAGAAVAGQFEFEGAQPFVLADDQVHLRLREK